MKNTLAAIVLATALPATAQTQYSSVPDLIRKIPYDSVTSQTVSNWRESRRQIMLNEGFCEEGKNVFLNRDGEFLGSAERITYDEEVDSQAAVNRAKNTNQQRIDDWRRSYRNEGNDIVIHPRGGLGYPFAFSCEERNKEFIQRGIDSYFGSQEESLVQEGWGQYSIDDSVTIREAFQMVEQNFPDFSEHTRNLLRGQLVIESGGDKYERSNSSLGLMQIMPDNLKNVCDLPEDVWFNEFAQIHCAYTFLEHHKPRIERAINYRFSNLANDQKEELLSELLVRGFHSGPEHSINMLTPRRGRKDACDTRQKENFVRGQRESASCFYALNLDEFKPEDISFGLYFHNLGAEGRGFDNLLLASLKYPTDAKIGYDLLEEKAQELQITVK